VQPPRALQQNYFAADISERDHTTEVLSVLPKYFLTALATTKYALNIRRASSFQPQPPGFIPCQAHCEASAHQNLQTHSG
jgi:hypothetical protein